MSDNPPGSTPSNPPASPGGQAGAGAPSDPPPSKLTLSGVVSQKVDATSTPLAGAFVLARDEQGEIKSAKTSADGSYKISGLLPGTWHIIAWHESCKTSKEESYVLSSDKQNVNFTLVPGASGLQLAGTVSWQDNDERVRYAQVKAIATTPGSSDSIKWSMTDSNGDFHFDPPLQPGAWSIWVLHEGGSSPRQPSKVLLTQDKTDLKLILWRRAGEADEKAGVEFFRRLCFSLAALILVYMLLHWFVRPQANADDELMLDLVTQAEGKVNSQEPYSTTVALSTTIVAIDGTWQVISATNPTLSSTEKLMIASFVHNLAQAVKQDDHNKAVGNFIALKHLLERRTAGFWWLQEPLRFLEILFWGMTGILVNLILTIGGYLRWGRFYREGIFLHLAQLVTVPLLALVFVFLVSTISLTIDLANMGNFTLDLDNPLILAAVAFLIGARPWATWDFLQETAGRLTGQTQNT